MADGPTSWKRVTSRCCRSKPWFHEAERRHTSAACTHTSTNAKAARLRPGDAGVHAWKCAWIQFQPRLGTGGTGMQSGSQLHVSPRFCGCTTGAVGGERDERLPEVRAARKSDSPTTRLDDNPETGRSARPIPDPGYETATQSSSAVTGRGQRRGTPACGQRLRSNGPKIGSSRCHALDQTPGSSTSANADYGSGRGGGRRACSSGPSRAVGAPEHITLRLQ